MENMKQKRERSDLDKVVSKILVAFMAVAVILVCSAIIISLV